MVNVNVYLMFHTRVEKAYKKLVTKIERWQTQAITV